MSGQELLDRFLQAIEAAKLAKHDLDVADGELEVARAKYRREVGYASKVREEKRESRDEAIAEVNACSMAVNEFVAKELPAEEPKPFDLREAFESAAELFGAAEIES
jgi:hypothetical protein